MSSLETKPFGFCPFCGETLTISETCRFCPYCGKRLKEKVNKAKKRTKQNQEEIVAADFAADQSNKEQVAPALEQMVSEPIRELAEELVAEPAVEQVKLPEGDLNLTQLPRKVAENAKSTERSEAKLEKNDKSQAVKDVVAVNLSVTQPATEPVVSEVVSKKESSIEDAYTLILKYCPDKEKLLRKLELVLRRDRFAIRLAIDMAPAVLMYKNKLAEVLPVLEACREIGAISSVVIGNFSLHVDLPPKLLTVLSEQEQLLVKKVSGALWIGEEIMCFAGDITADGEIGILALSDKHLIFLSAKGGEIGLRLTPIERILDVASVKQQDQFLLLVKQKNKTNEDRYLTKKQGQLLRLQEQLQRLLGITTNS